MDAQAIKYIAVALMSIGMAGAAIAIAVIFSSLISAIARNPSAEGKMAKQAIIGAALAEAMGIFAVGIAVILIFVV
ncbi:MAG: F0F1 ATP synthase subunit C [Rickettsiales bacterium]|nr:F0F1 ATP synthase subunit C [Rickettsiales bacterium]